MKKVIAIVCVIVLVCAVALLLSECSLHYSETRTVDGLSYTMHRFRKVCFADTVTWDEELNEMVLNIPDACDGYRVTSLGGFLGTGVPCPFTVDMDGADMYYGEGAQPDDALMVQRHLTINLGKYVEEIRLADMKGCSHIAQTDEYVQIIVSFNCAEDNETFYSKDGKLYYRENDALVEDFYYYADYETQ